MKSGMTRELIAGAMLLLASTPSQPETVNQYITDTGNPDLKEAMEAYAIRARVLLVQPGDDGGGEPRPDRARPLVLPSS
jgi:hypothetical protein